MGRKESDTTKRLNWTELKKAMNIMGMEKYIPVSETILILNLFIYLAVNLTYKSHSNKINNKSIAKPIAKCSILPTIT